MAINLICPECKSNLSLRARICKNCGYYFSNGKKYRVVVKDQNGRRISKVLNSLAIAKKLERKLKTQILENSLFGITKKPVIDEVWQKYLAWAKENKKSWKDDDMRWKCHVESYFAGKKMDTISAFDLQRVINAMKSKKDYHIFTQDELTSEARRIIKLQSYIINGRTIGRLISVLGQYVRGYKVFKTTGTPKMYMLIKYNNSPWGKDYKKKRVG